MSDDTNTTEDIPADAGANIVSAVPSISPVPPEAAADSFGAETVNDLVMGNSEPLGVETPPNLPFARGGSEPEIPTAQIPVNEPLEVETPVNPPDLATHPVRPGAVHPSEEGNLGTTPEVEIPSEPETPPSLPFARGGTEPETPPSLPFARGGTEPKTPPELPFARGGNSRDKNSLARELLAKGRSMLQSRKRKKLDKIMTLFLKHPKITNDEVEKLLHVSDATATRFLTQLEKENRIKQVGKTGHYVAYEKI
jgi:hypothetical protein